MYELLRLNRDKLTIISDEDYKRVKQFKWTFDGRYVMTKFRKDGVVKTIYLHRFIMNTPPGMITDHINGDPLDNRKNNLRICTTQQNMQNRKGLKGKTSEHKGVCYVKSIGKWQAEIKVKGKKIFLGRFFTAKDAAKAYNIAAKNYHGEYALLNKI